MKRSIFSCVQGLCVVACCWAIAGCGDLGTGGGPVEAKFSSLYGDYLSNCAQCHAPGAPGRTSDTEKTLDFTSKRTAYDTLTSGKASGLGGNFSACNGVAFVGSTAGTSLVVAVLDQSVRQSYSAPSATGCDADAVPDETVKVGSSPSSEFIAALKQWIDNGAADD